MFKSEGTHKVTITQAFLGDAKFNKAPGAFDVILKVEDEQGSYDFWRGEWSNEYGKGNASDKQQWELTQNTLKKLGMNGGLFENIQPDQNDIPVIPCLIGVKTEVEVEASVSKTNGKTYYNVKYIGTGSAPKAISYSALMQMMGQQPTAPTPVTSAPNPVANPAPSPAPNPAPASNAAPAPVPTPVNTQGLNPFANLAQPPQ